MSKICLTEKRSQIKKLNELPIVDRSLIDYPHYHKYIGHAGVKFSMAIQATRGCPFKCFFCDIHKTAKIHYRRSTDHLFEEVKMLAGLGVKRFEFIDDIFNIHKNEFRKFFEMVLKHKLDLNFFFPTGLRGDRLDHGLIDLMVEAGSVGLNLSLEHASDRIQALMRKNLRVELLRDNLMYISEKYPEVILTVNAMHGFPTETEEEAMMTLEFIESIKWIDFAYLHNVIIFPGTVLEKVALENGTPIEDIEKSGNLAYHQTPLTLPFTEKFHMEVKTKFLKNYVLNRDRLLSVLPNQLEQFSEDELKQKYSSYFPSKIKTVDDLLKIARIKRSELRDHKPFRESDYEIPELKEKLREQFPPIQVDRKDAFRLLLIDLSAYFSDDKRGREYNVIEPPLGLMTLLTYVNKKLGHSVVGKIAKSRIDFDNFKELLAMIKEFGPDMIGFRTMTIYKEFFHETVQHLGEQGVDVPIVMGGPYATASYDEILQDENIDLVVLAEGEWTFTEFLKEIIENNKKIPDNSVLRKINGLAFRENVSATTCSEKVLTGS